MGDLFDQLKSAGPVKKSNASTAKSVSPTKTNFTNTLNKFNDENKTQSSSIRRESMPSPITVSSVTKKSKTHKARSLSPKHGVKNAIKTLKVKLERKKIEEFLSRPLEEHANDIRKKQDKDVKNKNDNKVKNENKVEDVKKHPKITPTKAQQKLFEPLLGQKNIKAQMLKQFNIKPCKVRIRRENFPKNVKELKNKNNAKSKTNKRPSSSSLAESSPSKKTKLSATDNKNSKNKNNFFIKLNTSPPSKLEKKLKNLSKTTPSSEAHHNKIKNSKFNTTTAPTKFTRSELFRSFGKRFFNVKVKIERCTHPLLLTFESNNRARRLQSKQNKSKNLSVSFSGQVEIFGGSSDSDDSCGEVFSAVPPNRNNRKSNASNSLPVGVNPVVMPARLKKVENGKVVDDIELDPSLFLDPKQLISSTPYLQVRKKRDHKSFSPLKDECSPSPRKEKLKLANEGIPPGGLKRLNMEEDDDEEDDCEYIVPIEMPQRRMSRTSSNTTLDDLTSAELLVEASPVKFSEVLNNENIFATNKNGTEVNKQTEKQNRGASLTLINRDDGSDDSFMSANDIVGNYNSKNSDGNQFPALRFSQTSELQLEIGRKRSDDIEQLQQTNGNVCNEVSSKHLSTLNTMDDISINLFLEDSQTNEDDTNAKSFVDSLINETIDKLTKDIDEDATDKHYTDTN